MTFVGHEEMRGGMAKSKQTKIDEALQRLADMMPSGNIQASADPAGFLDDVSARIVRAESALKIIYTWSGVPGALHPDHVRDLCAKALWIDE